MAGNKMAQVRKMLERTQARMEKSEKKMELMAATLQTLIKDTWKKDGEKPHNEEGEEKTDDKKREKEG